MAIPTIQVGQGLIEPCSPYRTALVWGQPLNSPSANNWNCIPNIQGAATTFDVSGLMPVYGQVEAVVALLVVVGTLQGQNRITYSWYKESTGGLLYRGSWDQFSYDGGWFYGYTYLGLVDWEINENGVYRAEFSISGANPGSGYVKINITGFKAEEEEPEEGKPEGALSAVSAWIVTAIFNVADFFYGIYSDTNNWIPPFNAIAQPFYGVYRLLWDMGWNVHDFLVWFESIVDIAREALTWDNLTSWFSQFRDMITGAWDWVTDSWSNVTGIVGDWWDSVSVTVQGWIEAGSEWFRDVAEGFTNFIDNTWSWFLDAWDSFNVEWDNFWTETFPTLFTWENVGVWWAGRLPEIVDLIQSEIKILFPWYDVLNEVLDDVVEFFDKGPLDWLKDKAEDWFWG